MYKGLGLGMSLLGLGLVGCASVTPLGHELYSVVATSKEEGVRQAHEYCAQHSPSMFTIRNISGEGGFAPYKDPGKVEVVFRCQDLRKKVEKTVLPPDWQYHKPAGL